MLKKVTTWSAACTGEYHEKQRVNFDNLDPGWKVEIDRCQLSHGLAIVDVAGVIKRRYRYLAEDVYDKTDLYPVPAG